MNRDAPPLLFAHRGASGYRPEHTLEGYRLAIEMGADVIEPDLVISRDGVLVVRHENEISGTTNVASLPQFASRRRTQQVDGEAVTGWFVEDFTAAEIATLRARERLPALRPQSAAHDGRYGVPTLADVLKLLAEINPPRVAQGLQPIGVAPETKHPSHFAALGLPFEQVLLDTLQTQNSPSGFVWCTSSRLRWPTSRRCARAARISWCFWSTRPVPRQTCAGSETRVTMRRCCSRPAWLKSPRLPMCWVPRAGWCSR